MALDFVTFQKGLEVQEIPLYELYPRPNNAVDADVLVEGNKITLTLGSLDSNYQYVVVVTPEAGLGELYASYFTSTYFPAYCTARDVLAELSSLASLYTPHIVYTAIRNASLMADHLTDIDEPRTEVPFEVKQYVKYSSAYFLLTQLFLDKMQNANESMDLDVLRVRRYSPMDLEKLAGHIKDQVDYWEKAMLGRGKYPSARYTVKSGNVNPTPAPPRAI